MIAQYHFLVAHYDKEKRIVHGDVAQSPAGGLHMLSVNRNCCDGMYQQRR